MSYSYVLRQNFDFKPTYFEGMKNVMVFVTTNLDNVSDEVISGWEHMKDDDYFDKTIRFMKAQIDNIYKPTKSVKPTAVPIFLDLVN